MSEQQTNQADNNVFQGKICEPENIEFKDSQDSKGIKTSNINTIKNPEYEMQKKEMAFLVKKYLCYRSEGNMEKIHQFINRLNVTEFNRIITYFEEQRDLAKLFQVKQELAIIYADILEKRNTGIYESREKLYATNMEVEKGGIINSEWKTVDSDNKVKPLKDSNVELLANGEGYSITLDFGEGEPQTFHVEYTKDKTLVVKDKFGNPLKCNVELMGMDLKKENIGLGQERIINIKKFRILVGNLFFVLKFND